jgi:biotin carboxyl carrier protein
LKSPKSGTVAELRAEPGSTVNAGDVLVVVE